MKTELVSAIGEPFIQQVFQRRQKNTRLLGTSVYSPAKWGGLSKDSTRPGPEREAGPSYSHDPSGQQAHSSSHGETELRVLVRLLHPV